jgi:hypothetical protein
MWLFKLDEILTPYPKIGISYPEFMRNFELILKVIVELLICLVNLCMKSYEFLDKICKDGSED